MSTETPCTPVPSSHKVGARQVPINRGVHTHVSIHTHIHGASRSHEKEALLHTTSRRALNTVLRHTRPHCVTPFL